MARDNETTNSGGAPELTPREARQGTGQRKPMKILIAGLLLVAVAFGLVAAFSV